MATQAQREEIQKLLKPTEVFVDTQTRVTGKDENGYPVFETVFENPPSNYRLVNHIEPYNGAVLEDLDYVKPTE